MSIRLVKSLQHPDSTDDMQAKFHFGGDGREYGRVTLTVLQVTSEHRRIWKRAVERFGLKLTQVSESGPHPKSGLPRTISYSVQGLWEHLDEVMKLSVVDSYACGEMRIPYRCAGSGPEKKRPTTEMVREKSVTYKRPATGERYTYDVTLCVDTGLGQCDATIQCESSRHRKDAYDNPILTEKVKTDSVYRNDTTKIRTRLGRII